MKVSFLNQSLFLTFIITVFLLNSCTSPFNTLANNKKIDARLVGTWVGEEEDKQFKGSIKQWEMLRDDSGNFKLLFKVIKNGKVKESVEVGKWWVEKDVFYEYHENSKLIDTYKYKVINKNLIKFEMLKSGVNFNSDQYIFYDARKGTENLKL